MYHKMSQQYNIRADEIVTMAPGMRIVVSKTTRQEDTFLRNCLASFNQCIKPTLSGASEEIHIMPIIVHKKEAAAAVAAAPPEEKGIIVVSKSILCTLEDRLFRGNYYTFLMTHPLHGKKTSANVGYSTNPAYDVYLHNHLLTNDRTTSAAAPHWILDMVLGPFVSVEVAIECSNDLVSNTRGMTSKRKRASLLSRIYNVPLYDVAKKPSVPLKEYLATTAPPIYTQHYKKMVSSAKKKNNKKSIC